jgi:hypothetical protein
VQRRAGGPAAATPGWRRCPVRRAGPAARRAAAAGPPRPGRGTWGPRKRAEPVVTAGGRAVAARSQPTGAADGRTGPRSSPMASDECVGSRAGGRLSRYGTAIPPTPPRGRSTAGHPPTPGRWRGGRPPGPAPGREPEAPRRAEARGVDGARAVGLLLGAGGVRPQGGRRDCSGASAALAAPGWEVAETSAVSGCRGRRGWLPGAHDAVAAGPLRRPPGAWAVRPASQRRRPGRARRRACAATARRQRPRRPPAAPRPGPCAPRRPPLGALQRPAPPARPDQRPPAPRRLSPCAPRRPAPCARPRPAPSARRAPSPGGPWQRSPSGPSPDDHSPSRR